jgi:uncharacterized protein
VATRDPHLAAVRIVRDAGGELVGRTRLQKIAYLLQVAGYGEVFSFDYKHFGPFSDDLARGMEIASAFGQLREDERQAGWGGWYSVYRLPTETPPEDPGRAAFVSRAKEIGAVEIELAATAAYLYAAEGIGRTKPGNPWAETRVRKPEKARDGRLERAAREYAVLRTVPTPTPLPDLSGFPVDGGGSGRTG